MQLDELERLLPDFLQARYPSEHRRAGLAGVPDGMQDPGGWVVERDGVYCFLRVARGGTGFLWIRCGVAHAIPPSAELGFHVAAANKDLMVGRAYLAAGEDIAMVVLDETVFADVLSLSYEPSIQDLINRVETTMLHAAKLREELMPRFGGQAFSGEDWMLMALQ